MNLTLLTRKDCGLCEKAALLMREMRLTFEPVDIDADAELLRRYDEAIPVVLAGGREVCRAPITRESLRSGLARANLETGT